LPFKSFKVTDFCTDQKLTWLPISRRFLGKYCALCLKFMNLLKIYTEGVARSLCRRLLLDTVIVNVHSYGFVNHFFTMLPGTYQSQYKNSSGDEIANVNFLRRYGTYVLQNTNKNSSGDEIANVNFLTTISHTRRPTSKHRKRDKPTSFNKLDDG